MKYHIDTIYVINGVPHQIIRDENNVMLEVRPIADYETNMDELIKALSLNHNQYEQEVEE
jgi:hypothetical protein